MDLLQAMRERHSVRAYTVQKIEAAALLAPPAINQQKFKLGLKDGKPVIRIAGKGPYTKIDPGIVKYHFEVVSGYKID